MLLLGIISPVAQALESLSSTSTAGSLTAVTTERPPAVTSTDAASDNALAALPDLGSTSVSSSPTEKKLAEAVRQLGEAQMDDNSDQTWRSYLLDKAKNRVIDSVQQQSEALLAPVGYTNLSLNVSDRGDFTGSTGQLLVPLRDRPDGALTFSQLGLQDASRGVVGNAGLGQRWNQGKWLVGYNLFYDQFLQHNNLRRGGIGAEARGDYLRLSSNYYYPLSGMRATQQSDQLQSRLASGYDITTQGYLPFYRQIGASVKFEHYYGNRVDLFDSGNYRHNPSAVEIGLNYTPVPLMTLSAKHKQGDSGESQDQYALTVNYHLGVPLSQQLSSYNVAQARSLRGGRYDMVERNTTPVLDFKPHKSLSVFLATPPWSLQPGESLVLKVELHHKNAIGAVSWQGDTQAVSLTPPANSNQPDGWSVIMPAWDRSPGASNQYHLSLTVEDKKQQRVTSNWIVLQVQRPLSAEDADAESNAADPAG